MRTRRLAVACTLAIGLALSGCSAGETELAAAHAACTEPTTVAAAYDAGKSALPSYLQSFAEDHAQELGETVEEYHAALIAEIAVYDEDEDSLVIRHAFEQSDGELMPVGLLGSVVQTCILDEMEVPERVRSHLGSTRALDGTQEDAWDAYQARWTYHPESGTNLTIWRAPQD